MMWILHDCVCMIFFLYDYPFGQGSLKKKNLGKAALCARRAAWVLHPPEAHSDLSGAVIDCERRPAGSLSVGFACFFFFFQSEQLHEVIDHSPLRAWKRVDGRWSNLNKPHPVGCSMTTPQHHSPWDGREGPRPNHQERYRV